jgi:SpoVK/Ycf46/Vps4 family AAA+-type ATPase
LQWCRGRFNAECRLLTCFLCFFSGGYWNTAHIADINGKRFKKQNNIDPETTVCKHELAPPTTTTMANGNKLSPTAHKHPEDSKDPPVDFANRESCFLLARTEFTFHFTEAEELDAVDDSYDEDVEVALVKFKRYLRGEPSRFNKSNISRLSLFYGPPGTGKSRKCEIMARKMKDVYEELLESGKLDKVFMPKSPGMGFYFHCVSLADLTSCWQGRTEKNVMDVLYHIPKEFAISVILLDEVDSILGHSSSGESGQLMERVTKSFQALVQGGFPQLHSTTFILATSNMDKSQMSIAWVARFGKQIYVGPPQSANEMDKVVQTI